MVTKSKKMPFSLVDFIDSMGSAACWLDIDGDLRYMNAAFTTLTSMDEAMKASQLKEHRVGRWIYHASQKALCFTSYVFSDVPEDILGGLKPCVVRMLDSEGLVAGLLVTVVEENGILDKSGKINSLLLRGEILNQIIQFIPASVYWQDVAGIIIGCNLYQARALGCAAETDVIGKNPFDFFPKNTALALMKDIESIVKSKNSIVIEETGYSPAGEMHALSTKVPIFDKNNEVIGIIGISIDTTDQKKYEALLSQEMKKIESINASKDEFIMNIRHDFRTPLSGIIGYAECLRDIVPVEHRDRIDILVNSSRELVDLINNVIDVASIHSGEYEENSVGFSVYEMLDGLKALYEPACVNKNLSFVVDIDESVPRNCWGDGRRIKQIMIDIISNAINFTHVGGVSISIRLLKQYGREMMVSFRIQDTGIGMSQQQQEVVFQYFKRLTAAHKGMYSGLGLGLWRVKRFIEDLKGEIHMESVLGEGTIVQCIIPLRESLQN